MLKIIILFAVSITASGSVSYFYKKLAAETQHRSHPMLACAMWMFPVSLLFFFAAILSGGFSPVPQLTAAALLSGLAFAAAAYMLLDSMRKGSYTIAVIIVNLNFYIPILLSRLFLGEKATMLQLAGILFVTAAIIAVNIRADGKKEGLSGIISACAACLANGLVNFGIKLQQYLTPGEGQNTFFCLMYLFSAVFSLALFFILKGGPSLHYPDIKKLVFPATGIGICIAACFYPQSILSSTPGINAAAQFTVTVTGSLILSLALGWIRYKEKLTLPRMLSLVLCLSAFLFQIISY